MIINFPFLIQVGAQINHVIETGKAHSQGNHSYPVNIWYHEVKLTIPFHSKNMGGEGSDIFIYISRFMQLTWMRNQLEVSKS